MNFLLPVSFFTQIKIKWICRLLSSTSIAYAHTNTPAGARSFSHVVVCTNCDCSVQNRGRCVELSLSNCQWKFGNFYILYTNPFVFNTEEKNHRLQSVVGCGQYQMTDDVWLRTTMFINIYWVSQNYDVNYSVKANNSNSVLTKTRAHNADRTCLLDKTSNMVMYTVSPQLIRKTTNNIYFDLIILYGCGRCPWTLTKMKSTQLQLYEDYGNVVILIISTFSHNFITPAEQTT